MMAANSANDVARVEPDIDEIPKEEFDAAMAVGLAEAKAGKAAPVDEVFDRLIGELANG